MSETLITIPIWTLYVTVAFGFGTLGGYLAAMKKYQ